jgi:hypothetical protein
MNTVYLIVCERTGRWAVALKRALGDELKLIETRSLPACAAELSRDPSTVVAVEVTSLNLEAVLASLAAWQRYFPRSRAIALGDESLTVADHLLREAGAALVLHSTREVARAAKLVQCHAARIPAPDLPLEQAIHKRLPWAGRAAAG